MDAQIITDMPEDQYHAETGVGPGLWVTRSIIHAYCQSPSATRLMLDGHPMVQRGRNRGMDLGRLFEAMFCGLPYTLVTPPINKTTGKPFGASSQTYQDFVAKQPHDAIVATDDDEEAARFWIGRLTATMRGRQIHRACGKGLAEHQVTIRWTEEGVPCQARVDILLRQGGRGWAVDLKTTSRPLAQFCAVADQYGYDLQDAHYMAGLRAAGLAAVTGGVLWFAAVHTDWPFEGRVIRLPDEQRLYAIERRQAALRNIAGDFWEDPDELADGLLVPELPAYVQHKYGTEEDIDDGR